MTKDGQKFGEVRQPIEVTMRNILENVKVT
jgi:hypothetical protein